VERQARRWAAAYGIYEFDADDLTCSAGEWLWLCCCGYDPALGEFDHYMRRSLNLQFVKWMKSRARDERRTRADNPQDAGAEHAAFREIDILDSLSMMTPGQRDWLCNYVGMTGKEIGKASGLTAAGARRAMAVIVLEARKRVED
jgi:hypothetical protein